jgi:Chitin binding Peritrophin-A domain
MYPVPENQLTEGPNSGGASTESSNSAESTTNAGAQSPETTTATTNSGQQPAGSHGNCEREGYMADPTDCHKFIRCVDDGNGGFHHYDFTCGDGTAWDDTIMACNHEHMVPNCGSSQQTNGNDQFTTESTSTTESAVYTTTLSSTTAQTMTSFSSTNSQTTSFATTTNPITSTLIMSSSTNPSYTTTDPSVATQTTMIDSTTETSISGEDRCTDEGFFANSNDCHKFYRCVGDEKGGYRKFVFDCGPGTAWDQNLQTCNYEYQVESCRGSGKSKDICK